MNYFEMPPKKVIELLKSDENVGLDSSKALDLRLEYGYNKLNEQKKDSILKKFFAQFNDFMILILLAAAAISFTVSLISGDKNFVDPIIILVIVILNAVMGLVQENKAEKSLEALKKMSSPTAKVLRDGKFSEISAENLVPGDIIILETGDFVPADARLISSINLKTEESALTGESLPVEKNTQFVGQGELPIGDQKNMIFSGSSIICGRGKGIVTFTGMNTEVGKIAGFIMRDQPPQTPLQKKLEQTGKVLGLGALGICLIIFILGVLRNIPTFEMFMTSVSLAVAAIPEGLPAIVTIMLAIGVQRMSKRNAIIRKLPAVETLGSANVICSDKTGTLTQNKMTVVKTWFFNKSKANDIHTEKELLSYASLCNDSILETDGVFKISGDPTETALVDAAYNLGINKNKEEKTFPRINEIPFDSNRKLMSTLHNTPRGDCLIITKGAPDVLISICSSFIEDGARKNLDMPHKELILSKNTEMARNALRVLAVAIKTEHNLPKAITEELVESNLSFVGLIGMIDPPRHEVKEAVKVCKDAGIHPVMITGDHIITAKAIALELGILNDGDLSITGSELNEITDKKLEDNIYKYSVFARVSPEHKMKIVKAFQSKGAVVAMTGDGVNDAPALKVADIGCAMGISGTDVAKGAADMVLTDDNFATIVEAVKEGRCIYSNIKKAAHFLLSSNIGEIMTILVAIVLGWATPLVAIQLLWVNLITDSLPAIALGLDPPEKDIMKQKPYVTGKSLFSIEVWQRICFEGLMIGFLALTAYCIGHTFFDSNGSYIVGRTMAFATLSISQLVHAFNMRSDKSILSINPFGNLYLIGAFIIGLILQVSVINIVPLAKVFKVQPLSLTAWSIVLVLSFMPLVIVELQKFFANDKQ